MDKFDDLNDLGPTIESVEPIVDQMLDSSEVEDADIEFEATTSADDPTLDEIIGYDGKGSTELISDKDIDDIDTGKEPDLDVIDNDAFRASQDSEIEKLSKDIEDNSIVSKEDLKELKEGMSIEEYVGKVLAEDYNSEDSSSMFNFSDEENECPVCHCTPCVCKRHLSGEEIPTMSTLVISMHKSLNDALRNNDDSDSYTDSDNDTVVDTTMDEEPGDNLKDNTHPGFTTPSSGTDFESDDDTQDNIISIQSDDDDDFDDDMEYDDFEKPMERDTDITQNHVFDPFSDSPAGPVVPLQGNHIEEDFNNEEGDLNMFDDDDFDLDDMQESFEDYSEEISEDELFDEAFDDDFASDDGIEIFEEDVKGRHLSDDQVEDLSRNAMNYKNLDDVNTFNDFEGAGINAKQYGPDKFLTGDRTYRGEDDASNTFRGNQNTMPFSNVSIRSFDDMDDDPSISDMKK